MRTSLLKQRKPASNGRPSAVNRRLAVLSCSDRPLIIPVFIPHLGCPHQCAFCNQRAITQTESVLPSQHQLRHMVERYLAYSGKQRSRIQIAFYGGNFLGLAPAAIRSLLSVAEGFVKSGMVDGIRVSTRPDTVDTERLDLIAPYSVQTVELGAQSMQNTVLERSGRGHSVQDTISAVDFLRQRAYEIGLQLMPGLPGESRAGCFRSAGKAAELRPGFVRLYPAVVLAGSPMAAWYKAGDYTPLSLSECLEQLKQLVLFFTRRKIPITRIGLQAAETPGAGNQILAGPRHPALGHRVHCELFFDMARLLLRKNGADLTTITFDVHPRSVSRFRGLRNDNLMRLGNEYGTRDFQTRSDAQLPLDGLRLADTGQMLTYDDLQCDIL